MITLITHYLTEYHSLVRNSLVPFEGVFALVETLHDWGVLQGVVTSKRRVFRSKIGEWGLERELDTLRLRTYISVVVGHEDTGAHKPHPEPYLVAAERLRVSPERILIVGDAASDIEAGRAAGMWTAAALWGALDRPTLLDADPDFVLREPRQALHLISCPI